MGRLPRSQAHEFGILEDRASNSGHVQHTPVDATSVASYNHFAILQEKATNNGRSTPDFIDSLTTKLKELHIYSPKKNRADKSLLQPLRRHLNRSCGANTVFASIHPLKEQVERCNTYSAVAGSAQGPFPGEQHQQTTNDEDILSTAETHCSTAAATRRSQDSFDAAESCFFSQVLRAAHLEHHQLRSDSCVLASIARHKAGQYDYVLSVSYPDSSPQRSNSANHGDCLSFDFGCNVLVQTDHEGEGICPGDQPANAYKILATPLVREDILQDSPSLLAETERDMAIAEPSVRAISSTRQEIESNGQDGFKQAHSKELSTEVVEHPMDRVVSFSTDEGSAQEPPRTSSRATSASSQSLIEDSVEALDRLEEQLEAVNAAAHVRIETPGKSRRNATTMDDSNATDKTAVKRSGSTLKRTQSTNTNARPTALSRTPQRKSISTGLDGSTKGGQEAASPGKVPSKKPTVTRPTSLLPPKPPAKSTKPPTRPSFELPGEAVARRIKEQRDARLEKQAQEKAAATPQRTRSLKAPTRPNFELPGEAISRRKREEREARLRAQEEEERKRREFKARPIKANLASAAYPRETLASRARQNKGLDDSDGQAEQGPSKRTSMLGTLARSSSTKSPQTRGRGTSQASAPSQVSRATSTSTASMSGKRSTLSEEDLEQQRIKGREIFERDNCFVEDKERERREREMMAKLAREQAAERSRQASREWAEKQRRKQLATAAAPAGRVG
ncbi:hypothetical protein CCHL11_04756 [Colletotrichum chlorophyti]|uniref:Carboxylesterase family protein n=1 Tax=Colletotrichum chlorophyti TaxID=708187 RepID=A0A1Q8S1V6_9PEZI|nr:hypothetical protein CCHL11_04756 [Colletotrichum chlorophyti]